MKHNLNCWWKEHSTSLCTAFLINIFTFLIFIGHFMLTNHSPRFPWLDPFDQMHAARWFTPVTITALYSANLPVFSHLFSITTYLLGGLFAFKFLWERGTSTERTLFLLSLTLFPTSLTIFHYTWMGHQYAVAIFLGMLALYLAARGTVLWLLTAAGIIMCAMASYQAVFSVICTVCAAYLCLHWSSLDLACPNDRRIYVKRVINIGVPTAVGVVLYRLSLSVLGLSEAAVVSTLETSDLWARYLEVALVSFKHLSITQPELPLFTKRILLCFVVAAALLLTWRSATHQRTHSVGIISGVICLLLFVAAIVATKAMFLVSASSDFYTYRFNFSLAFFYAFCVFVVLRNFEFGLMNVILLTLIVVLCARYAQANLVRQNILLKGQQHDIALTSRIIDRIESHPNFDIETEYIFIRTGRLSLFRRQAVRSEGFIPDHPGDVHMTFGDIPGNWTPASLMPLLGSKIKFKYEGYVPNFAQEVERAKEMVVQHQMLPWPHVSSILIDDDRIYLHINQ